MGVHDCTVVVRSGGERTEGLCVDLLKRCLPSESIYIIRERPFVKAVAESFKAGIQRDRKWTMTVDADVLVHRNTVRTMIDRAEVFPGDLFIYQGYVLDYLFSGYREGGPHLYRTKHLPQAIEFVTSGGGSLRPESDAYLAMAERGYAFWVDTKIYGIHDYFQYRQDLVRKAYLHAIKHQSRVPGFLEQWIDERGDDDRRAAIVGLLSGLVKTEEVELDIRRLRLLAERLMGQYGIPEKDQILERDVAVDDVVDSTLAEHENVLKEVNKHPFTLRSKYIPARSVREWSGAEIAKEYCLKPISRRLAKALIVMGERLRNLT